MEENVKSGATGTPISTAAKANIATAAAPISSKVEPTSKPPAPTKPWKPAEILKVGERPGYRRKWVREDIVDKFLSEGWSFVVDRKKELNPPSTIVDGAPLSTAVRKRELVLMEITEALAKQRDAYYKSLTDGALEGSVREFKKVANEGSGKSYGEVKIIGGGGA